MGKKINNKNIEISNSNGSIFNLGEITNSNIKSENHGKGNYKINELDYDKLLQELYILRKELVNKESNLDEDITNIQLAISKTKNKEGKEAINYIKKLSNEVLSFAKNVGAGVVANIIMSKK